MLNSEHLLEQKLYKTLAYFRGKGALQSVAEISNTPSDNGRMWVSEGTPETVGDRTGEQTK